MSDYTRQDFDSDLLMEAGSVHYCGYWSTWTKLGPDTYHVEIDDACITDPQSYIIGPRRLAQGWTGAISRYGPPYETALADLDYDSDIVDVVVQLALFNEIRYA